MIHNRIGIGILALGVSLSGCSSEKAAPASGQWDLCSSLSADVGHHAGFVEPTRDDLDKGYDPTGTPNDDPRMCDRMTKDLNLTLSTWSAAAYAQKHQPGSAPYSNEHKVVIDGRQAAESHNSEGDCRLEFASQTDKVVVVSADTRPGAPAVVACDQLRPVATALSGVMPR